MKRYKEDEKVLNKKKIIFLIICVLIIVGTIIVISKINNKKQIDLEEKIEEKVIEEVYPPYDPFENTEKVEYKGPIEHIFFHPLVAYPELAFDGDYQAKGMDEYMATTSEFKRVIEELYNNNYVLINPIEFYETVTDENGTVKFQRKPVMFPINKKPVILSLDDFNYYEYMRENGCVYKLVLGQEGNVATYSKAPNGENVISYDNEVIPILDEFVKKHQDFSFNGAKGVIGLTGYDGILGYRTDSDSQNRESEIEAVKPVILRLKKTGWIFASHSYAHFSFAKVGYDRIKADTEKWKNEVETLIGYTPILLYPYGAWEKMDSEEHKYLVNSGFNIFCGVGIRQYEKIYSNFVFMDRKNIDGLTLRNRKNAVAHMFDVDKVIDLEARNRNNI